MLRSVGVLSSHLSVICTLQLFQGAELLAGRANGPVAGARPRAQPEGLEHPPTPPPPARRLRGPALWRRSQSAERTGDRSLVKDE